MDGEGPRRVVLHLAVGGKEWGGVEEGGASEGEERNEDVVTVEFSEDITTEELKDMVRDAIGIDLGGMERRLEHLEQQLRSSSGEVPAVVKELRQEVEALRTRLQNQDGLAVHKTSQDSSASNTPSSSKRKKRVTGKHQPYGRRDPESARQVYIRFMEISEGSACEGVRHWLRQATFESDSWSDEELLLLLQHIYLDLGLPSRFGITMSVLRRFLFAVYDNYNDVPFHNFRHCFCVAQMMYAMICKADLQPRIGELETFILITSCICHDLDHPGYNNIYQINARTELALRYNDISPLENHHCSVAFRILEEDPDSDILANLSPGDYRTVREGVIRCILATDMARHNEILAQFREIIPIFDYENPAHINLVKKMSTATLTKCHSTKLAMQRNLEIFTQIGIPLCKPCLQLSMVLIKVADISNEARPMNVAEPWLDRLLQEFFSQSDAEKMEGLPVTPFMDRDKVTKPSSQCSFIGYVLLPLFEALGDLLPELHDLIIMPVRDALDYYRRLNEAAKDERHRRSVDAASGGGGSSKGDGGTGAEDGIVHSFLDPNSAPSGTTTGSHSYGGNILTKSGSAHSMRSKRSLQWMRSHSHSHSRSYDGAEYEPAPQIAEKSRSIDATGEEGLSEGIHPENRPIDEEMDGEESDEEEEDDEEAEETVTEVEVSEKTLKFKISTEGSSTIVVPPPGPRKRRESRVEGRPKTDDEGDGETKAGGTQDVPPAPSERSTGPQDGDAVSGETDELSQQRRQQQCRSQKNHHHSSIMSRLRHLTERLSLGGGDGHGRRDGSGPSPPNTPPRPHSDCSGASRGRASPVAAQRKSASLGREGHGGKVGRGWRALVGGKGGNSSPAPEGTDGTGSPGSFLTAASPEELGNGTAGASPSGASSTSSSSAQSSRRKKGQGAEVEVEEEVAGEGSLARSLDSMLQRDHCRWWQHQRVGRSGGPSPSSRQRGFFSFSSARSRGEKQVGGRGGGGETRGSLGGGGSKGPPLLGGSIRRRKHNIGGQKVTGQGKVSVPLGDGVACETAN